MISDKYDKRTQRTTRDSSGLHWNQGFVILMPRITSSGSHAGLRWAGHQYFAQSAHMGMGRIRPPLGYIFRHFGASKWSSLASAQEVAATETGIQDNANSTYVPLSGPSNVAYAMYISRAPTKWIRNEKI